MKARVSSAAIKADPLLSSSEVAVTGSKRRRRERIGSVFLPVVGLIVVLLWVLRQTSSPAPAGTATSDIVREYDQTPAALLNQEAIPECKQTPWKENENLVGTCPSQKLKPLANVKTVAECAKMCCSDKNCITWQFRGDTGCLQGGDVRLGMEKDGTPSWCSDLPPQQWQGQFIEKMGNKRSETCSTVSWNPNEQPGQCFGLGDVRKGEASTSAEACMRACCSNEIGRGKKKKPCGAWQWNAILGCFYGGGMHSCQRTDNNPHIFAPFVGRRKRLETRTYTDQKGRPWQQVLPSSSSSRE